MIFDWRSFSLYWFPFKSRVQWVTAGIIFLIMTTTIAPLIAPGYHSPTPKIPSTSNSGIVVIFSVWFTILRSLHSKVLGIKKCITKSISVGSEYSAHNCPLRVWKCYHSPITWTTTANANSKECQFKIGAHDTSNTWSKPENNTNASPPNKNSNMSLI